MMRLATFASIAMLPVSLSAQAPTNNFDPSRAPVIDKALQRYVDAGKVAGIVALVMQDGKVVYDKAFGWADREAGRRMTTDTIFRIASQTKALTSTAVMQLIEEGALALSTRAGTLIPSFAQTQVAIANPRGVVRQVPATRAITIALGFTSVDDLGAEDINARYLSNRRDVLASGGIGRIAIART